MLEITGRPENLHPRVPTLPQFLSLTAWQGQEAALSAASQGRCKRGHRTRTATAASLDTCRTRSEVVFIAILTGTYEG